MLLQLSSHIQQMAANISLFAVYLIPTPFKNLLWKHLLMMSKWNFPLQLWSTHLKKSDIYHFWWHSTHMLTPSKDPFM